MGESSSVLMAVHLLKERFLHGRARFIATIRIDEARDERQMTFHTTDWTELDWQMLPQKRSTGLKRPERLHDIIAMAEKIGAEMDFARIDIYDCDGQLFLGEVTLYENSGQRRYHPCSVDALIGSYWTIQRPASRAIWTMMSRRRPVAPWRTGSLHLEPPLPP